MVGSPSPRPRLLLATTSSASLALMRGQPQHFSEAGFEVFFVSSPGPELETLAGQSGVRVCPIPMRREIAPLADLLALCRLYRLMRTIKPDITNVGTPKAGLLAGMAAWMAGVPCRILTLRGLRTETLTGRKGAVVTAMTRLSCAAAHRVISVSPSLRQRAIAAGLVSPEKITVLGDGSSNGVDEARFGPSPTPSPQAQELRARLGLPSDSLVIGFVGRFTRDKGVADLVEAFELILREIPRAYLLLVGDFEAGDPLPPAVRERILHHPHILSTQPAEDLPLYYHLMDLVALPTYREGFPNVALEAQASARPVVTTRATGAIDSVVDGETGLLVDSGDVGGLARAIVGLLKDPKRRTVMGSAGRERILRHFTRQRVWQRLEEHYRLLLKEQTTSAGGSNLRPSFYRRVGKRALDLALAWPVLLVLSPLMLLLAMILRIKLGYPVVFRQPRPGRDGKPFVLLKFRTMIDATDGEGRPLPDAQRLPAFGKWLRSTSLDELPELLNVLRGEMSLVGPRPLLMQYMDRYTATQRRRHEVLPGITGWAQVHGRNAISWQDKFEHDVWYVDHCSLALDVRILARTLFQVVRARGISPEGHATMPEFLGAQEPRGNEAGDRSEPRERML